MFRAAAFSLAGLVMLPCCRAPQQEASFSSVDPQERTAAVLEAARSGDPDAIPSLIATLESTDPAQRMLAHRTLRRMTGLDFGYDHAAPTIDRRQAVDRWEEWWKSERTPESAEAMSGGSDAESADDAGATRGVRGGDGDSHS